MLVREGHGGEREWPPALLAAGPPHPTGATRLLAYLRGLSDHQLLALLADLPWARLDALLDAVNTTAPLLARSPRS